VQQGAVPLDHARVRLDADEHGREHDHCRNEVLKSVRGDDALAQGAHARLMAQCE
jgi:hypothetical protein